MRRCPNCKLNMVGRDDTREVCIACGHVVADDTSDVLFGTFGGGVSPLVAHRAANSTWHSGIREADQYDDGYEYGITGERHSRKLVQP